VILVGDDGNFDSMFKVSLEGNFYGGAETLATSVDSHIEKTTKSEMDTPSAFPMTGVLNMKIAGRIRNVHQRLTKLCKAVIDGQSRPYRSPGSTSGGSTLDQRQRVVA
jgi:hypothetical protein